MPFYYPLNHKRHQPKPLCRQQELWEKQGIMFIASCQNAFRGNLSWFTDRCILKPLNGPLELNPTLASGSFSSTNGVESIISNSVGIIIWMIADNLLNICNRSEYNFFQTQSLDLSGIPVNPRVLLIFEFIRFFRNDAPFCEAKRVYI